MTYDGILTLLQDIEEENIEEISEEKIERITLFIAFLAQKGKLPGEYAANLELENDIAALFENKDTFFNYAQGHEFAYASNFNFSHENAGGFAFENAGIATLLNGGMGEKASLCGKSNAQKKAEKDAKKAKAKQKEATKKAAKKNVKKQENNSGHHDHKHRSGFTKIKDFIVKHRKAIIIGAIIIVAVTAVIVAVAVLSPAGAAAAGAAAGAVAGASTTGSDSNEQDKPEEDEEEQDPFSTSSYEPEMPSTSDMPVLASVIEESISNFKETVVEEDLLQTSNQSQGHEDAALEEIARNLGSTLAHQVLDGIAGLVSCVPHLLEEIQNIGNQIIPESILGSPVNVEITPMENFENMLADGHNGIDELFSTNQAFMYTPEAKESGNKYVIGILPPPGTLTSEIGQLKQAGKLEGVINNTFVNLINKPGYELLKNAINEDKHVKFIKDYFDKPEKEIIKSIKSYEKQIAIHQEKIANPSKSIPKWDELHPERKNALINKKWPAEIQCFSEQKEILQTILNQRSEI